MEGFSMVCSVYKQKAYWLYVIGDKNSSICICLVNQFFLSKRIWVRPGQG